VESGASPAIFAMSFSDVLRVANDSRVNYYQLSHKSPRCNQGNPPNQSTACASKP